MALVKAYAEAESDQAGVGSIPRMDLPGPLPVVENPRPVDLRTEQNPLVRFTFIESEMMCRGQQGKWQLSLVFPKALEAVPLILIQGRYDQICLPEVAQQVFRTWPGSRKLLVPLNGGHASYRGPGKVERLKAGLNLTPEQEAQLDKALGLAFGNAVCLLSAAIDCLQNPNPGH